MGVRERGIIFNTEMVKAILDGRKTVSRRLLKFDIENDGDYYRGPKTGMVWFNHREFCNKFCTYGQIGDRLYVRETWAVWKDPNQSCVMYKANNGHKDFDDLVEWIDEVNVITESKNEKWENPAHMPKKYARIWLEVTDIRVERVQDITVEEIIKEGFVSFLREHDACCELKQNFFSTWESIYGTSKGWVWVIEFKKILP